MMSFGLGGRLAFCCPRRSTQWTPIGVPRDETGIFKRSYKDFIYSTTLKLFFCLTVYGFDIPYDEGKKYWPFMNIPEREPPCKVDLEGWDLGDPLSPRIDWAVSGMPESDRERCFLKPTEFCRHVKYLVFAEHSNQLYLVRRHINRRMRSDGSFVKHIFYDSSYRGWDCTYPYKTIGFDVYKVDREGGKLTYMEGHLDDLVMFIGSTTHLLCQHLSFLN